MAGNKLGHHYEWESEGQLKEFTLIVNDKNKVVGTPKQIINFLIDQI